MKRREFLSVLGGAAWSWPFVALAQQNATPVVGFLRSASLADATHLVAAFRAGLMEAGFVEGRNVKIELRSADDHPDRLPGLVNDLILQHVAVIVGDNIAALAAKAVTTIVPIVFAGGGDPVQEGLVASFNRPSGNVTGVNFFTGAIGTKRLELLRQMVPRTKLIALLMQPNTIQTEEESEKQ